MDLLKMKTVDQWFQEHEHLNIHEIREAWGKVFALKVPDESRITYDILGHDNITHARVHFPNNARTREEVESYAADIWTQEGLVIYERDPDRTIIGNYRNGRWSKGTGFDMGEGNWQTMETAPEDGTYVDLWAYGTRYTSCTYDKGQWENEHNVLDRFEPTYWMPIPAPPKGEHYD